MYPSNKGWEGQLTSAVPSCLVNSLGHGFQVNTENIQHD